MSVANPANLRTIHDSSASAMWVTSHNRLVPDGTGLQVACSGAMPSTFRTSDSR